MTAGIVCIAWATASARGVDLDRSGELVTKGIYGRARHPMYLGWAALHLGSGLVARAGWVFATGVVASAVVHEQARREEQDLARRFGTAYTAYRSTVPRYLPAVRVPPRPTSQA